MDLNKVIHSSPFPFDKKQSKEFLKKNPQILDHLMKLVSESKKNKSTIATNVVLLLSYTTPNIKMLPILYKLLGNSSSKSTTLRLLKLLETVLSITNNDTKTQFDPLLFYDYLMSQTKSSGQLTQIYSLLSLHHLIVKHNLTVPSYIQLLYSTLTPRLLSSPILQTYYDRLYKYLTSNYIPIYSSASFVKKSLHLCLEAPAGSILILLQFVMKMLYSLPQIRFLLHKPAVPIYRYPEVDPFETKPFTSKLPSKLDLRETLVEKSFLWEQLLLQKHVHPKIALLAQSFPLNEDDKVSLPPELGIKDIIDPKLYPITTSLSSAVNPFLVIDNNQGVCSPNKDDCETLELLTNHHYIVSYLIDN
ncbi:CCAAT-binding factor domain-containing protein [Entamoeba marina]